MVRSISKVHNWKALKGILPCGLFVSLTHSLRKHPEVVKRSSGVTETKHEHKAWDSVHRSRAQRAEVTIFWSVFLTVNKV